MTGWQKSWGLGMGLILLLTVAGCSDVLVEAKRPDGGVERVRVDGGESWTSYDDKPRNPYTKAKKDDPQSDMTIMLKKESTF